MEATRELGPSEVLVVGQSVYRCNEVDCGATLDRAVIGRRKMEIYQCPKCKTLYLVPWNMTPYLDAVPMNA